ncbi:MAG: type II 3-dehydroquinate dehydratase [Betaproteobacteria bacterium]
MLKVLIVHGAGMNMRGKTQLDIFGPMTLPEYDEHIRNYATELGIEAEIFHSNVEGEVINKFYQAHDRSVDAAVINPAGYTTGYPALMAAISQVKFPTIELHISNPARRGRDSEIARVCRGVVTGFGIYGYYLALSGLRDMLGAPAKKSSERK